MRKLRVYYSTEFDRLILYHGPKYDIDFVAHDETRTLVTHNLYYYIGEFV